ncbi:hypothetical protein [Silvanigrella aquatica]|uniref:hypothetical protein n=1 Tax=Silvanigrella aquatica TaxID=1915309 RepID=UPI000A636A19|nr:hypothetical protein [Silvanigrella aquatica]
MDEIGLFNTNYLENYNNNLNLSLQNESIDIWKKFMFFEPQENNALYVNFSIFRYI